MKIYKNMRISATPTAKKALILISAATTGPTDSELTLYLLRKSSLLISPPTTPFNPSYNLVSTSSSTPVSLILYLVVILTWFSLPNVTTWGISPNDAVSLVEMSSVVTGLSNLTTYVRPPVKSIPGLRPLTNNETTPPSRITPET